VSGPKAMNATADALVLALQAQLAEFEASERARDELSWLIFCGSMVFFMQAGFGMLEAGAVASKSTQDIMLKNLFDASLGAVLWWAIGYGFTNEGGNGFIGIVPTGSSGSLFATYAYMRADANSATPQTTGLEWADVWFQYTFASVSATIVSGAVAERAQLPAYLCFSAIITGIIYPVVAHWCWSSSGWVSTSNPNAFLGGMVDFAGSGVVHMTGGLAALLGALIIGPRPNRFDESGAVLPLPGHSAVLQVLGTFILWLGWYGFNAGSSVEQMEHAGRIVLTTTLAGASGGISAVVLERVLGLRRVWDVCAMCNGALAGLVSITAGCATLMPWAAVIMGVLGGVIYRQASRAMQRRRIDDPLDAFAVHGACGMWGLLGCALFTSKQYAASVAGLSEGGVFYNGFKLLGATVVFTVAHFAWVGTCSGAIFLLLKKVGMLRAPHDKRLDQGDGTSASPTGTPSSSRHDGSIHLGSPYLGPTPIDLGDAALPAKAPGTEVQMLSVSMPVTDV